MTFGFEAVKGVVRQVDHERVFVRLVERQAGRVAEARLGRRAGGFREGFEVLVDEGAGDGGEDEGRKEDSEASNEGSLAPLEFTAMPGYARPRPNLHPSRPPV